jgi:uncharacterized protein
MKRGELEHQLTKTNPWWRATERGRDWTTDDPDLRAAAEAPFVYRPQPLDGISPGGIYRLFGPRRVGKSVELKRTIANLIDRGTGNRRIVHAACDTWRDQDLDILVDVLDGLSPPAEGSRYVFLDEITAIRGDWVTKVKWLRDNTSLRNDCVVLSGSSAESLEQARSELAGRRGAAIDADRLLLPMGFRAFCRASGIDLPRIPTIHPRDLLGREAGEATQELRVHLNELVPAWERYLDVGGFPRAVAGWLDDRQVPDAFMSDLWDVVYGEALRGEDRWTATESQKLLEQIVARMANPFAVQSAARELDVHRDTLRLRLHRLTRGFVLWPCFQNDGRDRPRLRAQRKIYFLDPLLARLAAHRAPERTAPPNYTVLTEQQLGVTLLRARDNESPGTLPDFDSLLYATTPSRKEIDFTGAWLDGLAYEGKYVEGETWLRDGITAEKAYGRAVLATRTIVDRVRDLLALPACLLGLLLDPSPLDAIDR